MAPTVTLEIPIVLEPVVGSSTVRITAANITDALEAACVEHPALRHHLTTERGDLRPHVLCLHNGVHVRRDAYATTRLASGDTLTIHQAISGG